MQLTDSSNVYTSVNCQKRNSNITRPQLDALLWYCWPAPRPLEKPTVFWCGRHQYGRVNKLTRDSFRSSWAMNSEGHGFWSAILVFNASILYPFKAFKNHRELLNLYLRLLSALISFSHSQQWRFEASLNMASTPPTPSNRSKSVKKSMRQKQGRRKSSLMKKASEYSKMCDADVCVGIRLRETGQVFILSADASGFWAFLGSQLVCPQLCLWWKDDWPIKNSYYPSPMLVTDQDLEQVDKDTPEQHTWSCTTKAEPPPDQNLCS